MATVKERYKQGAKRWLDTSLDEAGAIMWEVSGESWGPDVSLTMRDCTSQVHFSFDFSDEKGRRERLRKADVLINELRSFREALENVPLKDSE